MLTRRHLLQNIARGALASPFLATSVGASGVGTDYDVIVIGAGIAGLTVAQRLSQLGPDIKVLVMEGRDRIGGRVESVRHEQFGRHSELGAWYLQPAAGLAWPPIDMLGLQAETMGEHVTLKPGMSSMAQSLAGASAGRVQLNSLVREIFWREGLVGINYGNRGLAGSVTARRLVMTMPAPVLLKFAASMTPTLPERKRRALSALKHRPAVSMSMLFPVNKARLKDGKNQWLEESSSSRLRAFRSLDTGDLLLEAQLYDTRAEALVGQSESLQMNLALRAFAPVLEQTPALDDARWSRFADWLSDPLSLGASPIDTKSSIATALRGGLEDTVFFAGDSTVETGIAGSVHGAYASGLHAAAEVAASLGVSESSSDPNEPILQLL